jgi:hypothetical protein
VLGSREGGREGGAACGICWRSNLLPLSHKHIPTVIAHKRTYLPRCPMQSALIDPLPEVRATAAKAMGSLVKGECCLYCMHCLSLLVVLGTAWCRPPARLPARLLLPQIKQ